jgi:hypothetical protein
MPLVFSAGDAAIDATGPAGDRGASHVPIRCLKCPLGMASGRSAASGGPKGPKRIVQDILDGLDRDSLLDEVREQILARLRVG